MKKTTMKDKNLLVISPFPSNDGADIGGLFVKDHVSIIKDYFNEVVVIEPIPYVPNFLASSYLKKYFSRTQKKDYTYDNVSVYFPRFFMLPIKRDLFDVLRFMAVNNVIRKHNIKFSIIHAHFTWPFGYIGAKLKDKYNTPLIITVHGDPFRGVVVKRPYKPQKEKILLALNEADKITTPHQELYNYLCSLGFKEKTILIEKHVELERFRNIEKYRNEVLEFKKQNKLMNNVIITFIASLNKDKDPLTFVRCIPQVIEKNKHVIFLIAGAGELINEILNEIKRLHVEDYCRVLGQRTYTNIIYFNSDIFCALSPLGNIWSGTVQEAFAAGVPVIMTKTGMPGEEYLEHKKTVYFIAPKSPIELANSIFELLKDEKLRRKIIENEKKFADNNWSPKKISEKWFNLYSSL